MRCVTIRCWAAAGLLGFAASACDGGGVVTVEDAGTQSDELKAFLESPAEQSVSSGAHRPNDPHAKLGPMQMAQVALQHLDESRTQLALDTLGEAIGKYPDNVMLLSVRASIFLQSEQTSLALADLNRAVEIDPHDPVLLTNRAQALRRFDRSEDALRDLDSALELKPDFVAALFNRGSLRFEAEQYAEALADFERCIEIDPELPAAWFNLASTRDAMGQREQAIGDLEHFLSLSPEPGWIQIANDLLAQWRAEVS